MMYRILTINPGSTSTKIAIFEDEREIFKENIVHTAEELSPFNEIQEQLDFRTEVVRASVETEGFSLRDIDVFVGRGGGILACEGGTYRVTDFLFDHASRGVSGHHPAQLASQICRRFADEFGGEAFVVNPPDVDEFDDISRIAGLKGVYRESHLHALNQKEVAMRFCASRGMKYTEANLVVCHLGGGISITAHKNGKMIDSTDNIRGTGPMTPTRAGDLPFKVVIDLAYSGQYTKTELVNRLNKNGGFMDIFGTANALDIRNRADAGDETAKLVYDGMNYQIAKNAAAMAAALCGKVDAIILTGGLARDEKSNAMIREHIGWIAEVVEMPGEFELEALCAGALRVLRGEEQPKEYTGEPVWEGY